MTKETNYVATVHFASGESENTASIRFPMPPCVGHQVQLLRGSEEQLEHDSLQHSEWEIVRVVHQVDLGWDPASAETIAHAVPLRLKIH